MSLFVVMTSVNFISTACGRDNETLAHDPTILCMPSLISKTDRCTLGWVHMPLHSPQWMLRRFELRCYAHEHACGEAFTLTQHTPNENPHRSIWCSSHTESSRWNRHLSVNVHGPLVCMLRVSPAGRHRYVHVWTWVGAVKGRECTLSEGRGTGSYEASLLAQSCHWLM